MRTAMIAALSCALLGGPLPALSLECPVGDAGAVLAGAKEIVRPPEGDGATLSATAADIRLIGVSALDVDALQKTHELRSLVVFVQYQQRDPVNLKFRALSREFGQTCLQFDRFNTTSLERRGFVSIYGVAADKEPELCFGSSNQVQMRFTAEVNTVALPLGSTLSPNAINAHALVRRSSDGEDVALFDTDGAACRD